MKNCPGHPEGSCRDRIPDGWRFCQRCRQRRIDEKAAAVKPPAPETPATACQGAHSDPPAAEVRVRYRAPGDDPDRAVLAVEDLCQPCADAVILPWVRAQREPLVVRR